MTRCARRYNNAYNRYTGAALPATRSGVSYRRSGRGPNGFADATVALSPIGPPSPRPPTRKQRCHAVCSAPARADTLSAGAERPLVDWSRPTQTIILEDLSAETGTASRNCPRACRGRLQRCVRPSLPDFPGGDANFLDNALGNFVIDHDTLLGDALCGARCLVWTTAWMDVRRC